MLEKRATQQKTGKTQSRCTLFAVPEPKLDFTGGQRSIEKQLKMNLQFSSSKVWFLLQIGGQLGVTFEVEMIEMRI